MGRPSKNNNKKDEQLEKYRVRNTGKILTTSEGLKVSNNEETLKAGARGPAFVLHDAFKLADVIHRLIQSRKKWIWRYGCHEYGDI